MRTVIVIALIAYSFLATAVIRLVGGRDGFQFGFLCIVLGIVGGAMPFFIDKHWPS